MSDVCYVEQRSFRGGAYCDVGRRGWRSASLRCDEQITWLRMRKSRSCGNESGQRRVGGEACRTKRVSLHVGLSKHMEGRHVVGQCVSEAAAFAILTILMTQRSASHAILGVIFYLYFLSFPRATTTEHLNDIQYRYDELVNLPLNDCSSPFIASRMRHINIIRA